MKMSTATVIFAAAALAAPAAVGQSQGNTVNALHQVGAAAAELVQVSASSMLLPRSTSRSFDLDGNRSSGSSSSFLAAPHPAVAWVMALGFLGFVAVRRTRYSRMR